MRGAPSIWRGIPPQHRRGWCRGAGVGLCRNVWSVVNVLSALFPSLPPSASHPLLCPEPAYSRLLLCQLQGLKSVLARLAVLQSPREVGHCLAPHHWGCPQPKWQLRDQVLSRRSLSLL